MPAAERDAGSKLFMGELTKTDNAGKMSPGPVYMYQDSVKYDNVSRYLSIFLNSNSICRCLAGRWAQRSELVRTNRSTISMRMLFSLMTRSRPMSTESQGLGHPRSELSPDSRRARLKHIQVHSIDQERSLFTRTLKNIPLDIEEMEKRMML